MLFVVPASCIEITGFTLCLRCKAQQLFGRFNILPSLINTRENITFTMFLDY